MSITKRQRMMLLIGIACIAILTGSVFGTMLATIVGPKKIRVRGVRGTLEYKIESGTWSTNDIDVYPNQAWYVRINKELGSWSGLCNATWILKTDPGGTAIATKADFTLFSLNSSQQYIYCSPDGLSGAGEFNWGTHTGSDGDYQMTAEVETRVP